ncbi:hypothetical protein BDZ91DRAFT_734504 [Kalaharituber pfeilii]|nr:hypothetical protein BDZ91DRAFT_734504 [Kalaharituber pfeilii]
MPSGILYSLQPQQHYRHTPPAAAASTLPMAPPAVPSAAARTGPPTAPSATPPKGHSVRVGT